MTCVERFKFIVNFGILVSIFHDLTTVVTQKWLYPFFSIKNNRQAAIIKPVQTSNYACALRPSDVTKVNKLAESSSEGNESVSVLSEYQEDESGFNENTEQEEAHGSRPYMYEPYRPRRGENRESTDNDCEAARRTKNRMFTRVTSHSFRTRWRTFEKLLLVTIIFFFILAN